MMIEKHRLQLILRPCVFEGGLRDINVAGRHGQFGGSHIHFHLRFLGRFHRDRLPGQKRLFALVC